MARVKDTIVLLTKILKENVSSNINAETFRLAKFNDDAAVSSFWKLLFELVYFCHHGHIDEAAFSAFTELYAERELVIFVKRQLQLLGYLSEDFAQMPNEMRNGGSRELLLAMGWLLCSEDVIAKFMMYRSSPLDQDLLRQIDSPLDHGKDNCVAAEHKIAWFRGKASGHAGRPDDVTAADQLKEVVLLNGKLKHSLKSLYNLQRQSICLQHKVHESTVGLSVIPGRPHLSLVEIQLINHPHLIKKVLQLLEEDNQRLNNLLLWREQEDTFWQWMLCPRSSLAKLHPYLAHVGIDRSLNSPSVNFQKTIQESVLELKLQSGESHPHESLGPVKKASSSVYNLPEGAHLTTDLQEAQQNLHGAIIKYEHIIVNMERVWMTKRSALSEADLDTLLSSINLDIRMHQSYLNSSTNQLQTKDVGMAVAAANPVSSFTANTELYPNTSSSTAVKFYYHPPKKDVHRPKWKDGNAKTSFMEAQSSEGDTGGGDHTRINDLSADIVNLKDKILVLERRISSKRVLYQEQLDQSRSQLPDLICIPPMSTRGPS